MKRILKSIAVVLSIIIAFSMVFTACGTPSKKGTEQSKESSATEKTTGTTEKITETTSKEKVTISFWMFLPEERFGTIIGYFKVKNENVEVEYEQIPTADYLGTKLMVAFAAGEGPDVFAVNASSITKYYDADVAYPLDGHMTPDIIADFLPKSLEKNTFDGKLCALPLNMDMGALFYNVNILKDANIEPPKTWYELRDNAIALTTEDLKGIYFPLDKSSMQVYFFVPFLWAAGADVFTPDKKHSALNSDVVAEVLQIWKDMYEANAVIMKPSGGVPVLDKEVAMDLSISGVLRLLDQYPDVELGVLPIPGPTSDKFATITGGWSLMANAKNKNCDEAARFIVESIGVNIDGVLEFTSTLSYSPRYSVMKAGEDLYFKNETEKQYFEKMSELAIPEIRAPIEVYNILEDMIQDALYTSTGKEAAQKAHEKLEEFLSEYEGSL